MIRVPYSCLIRVTDDFIGSVMPWVHLYVTEVTDTPLVDLVDFTECSAPGYSSQKTTGWTSPVIVDGAAVTQADPLVFSRGTGPPSQDVWGYYVTDGKLGPLLWWEPVGSVPMAFRTMGDIISVVARWSEFQRGTPCPATAIVTGDLVGDGIVAAAASGAEVTGDLVGDGIVAAAASGAEVTGDLVGDGIVAAAASGAEVTGDLVGDGIVVASVEEEYMTGAIIGFAGSSIPSGWLECDGAAVSRSTYAALFAAIGTAYGVGDGSTTFNVPDLRDCAPIGVSPGSLSGGRATARARGDVGGEEDHVLTVAELAGHTHQVALSYDETTDLAGLSGMPFSTGDSVLKGNSADVPENTSSETGSGDGHNTVQPFGVLYWIIQT
jgi:microcystin-dependent protein